ncbi:MAG: response regulator, partial [Pseudomonadota bacterium]
MRLLVVDDIAANREVARALLRADGHVVETASGAIEALRLIEAGGVDAVLMDLQMPDIDGLEATRRIRALPAPMGKVPILAVTASALPEQIDACREAGMDGHLAKPIERHALARALAELRIAPAPDAPRIVIPAVSTLLGMDVLDGLRRELGDAEADAIIAEFRAELEEVRALLDNPALDTPASAPQLRQIAHRALGAARNLGAASLAEKSHALEVAARDGQPVVLLRALVMALAAETVEALEAQLNPAL